jgi:outer membrane cobalamin receptor
VTHLRRALVLTLLLPMMAWGVNLGIIDGTIRDELGAPIAGARVRLLARGDRVVDEHMTDDGGHFAFEQVPFGQYMIAVTTKEGRKQSETIRVDPGDVTQADLVVAQKTFGEEIVVTAPRPRAPEPAKTAASQSTLERHDIEQLPRGDTASVNEVLATQPGFVYDAFGSLFARGNHANIQYELDGVRLPDSVSGVFGGFLSPKFIENIEVITGGLGAEYGERLAAVVNLNSRRPSDQGEGALEMSYGSFGTLNPSGLFGKRVGNLSVLMGGSFRDSNRALDPQAISPVLHDRGDEERGFLRLDYELGDRDHVSAVGTFSRNFYRVPIDPTVKPVDPNQPDGGRFPDQFGNPPPPFFPRDTNSTETELDGFGLLSWRHDFDARTSVRVAGYYRHSYGFLFGDAPHALGPTQDPCSIDDQGNASCATASDVTRRADHGGGNAEYLVRLGEDHVLRVGGGVDQLLGRDDFTFYTRSDVLQGPDPALTARGRDTSHATSGGAYVTDRATFGKFVVNAGLRFDFQKVSFIGTPDQATQTGFGPRLGIAYVFSPDTVIHAFGGLMWMPPPVLDTPAAARILGVVPADQPVVYDLVPERDRYAEIGIESRVIPALTLKLTAWGKLSNDQLDDVEVGSTNLISPYNFKQGRAGGIEAGVVGVVTSRFSLFGNVSLERAQGRGIATAKYLFSADDLANPGWQILDHVQTWTANAGGTLRLGGAQASALMNYGSGLRTGPANDKTVPDHVRVDLTLGYDFKGVPGRPMIALDIVNLLDARYAYRISNGFNGSHFAPERSAFVRASTSY